MQEYIKELSLYINLIIPVLMIILTGISIIVVSPFYKAIRLSKIRRKRFENAPELVDVNEVQGPTLSSLVDELVDYSKRTEIDFIVGLHTSGRLLSAHIASQIGLHPASCRYLSADQIRGYETFDRSKLDGLNGRVLIVDDVIRTGSSMSTVHNYLLKETVLGRQKIDKIKFATIGVIADQDVDETFYLRPSFYALATSKSFLSFPWSPLTASVRDYFESSSRWHSETGVDCRPIVDWHNSVVDDFDEARKAYLFSILYPDEVFDLCKKQEFEALIDKLKKFQPDALDNQSSSAITNR